MWKSLGQTEPAPAPEPPAALPRETPTPRSESPFVKWSSMGPHVAIKGNIVANEDLTIDGELEGSIEVCDGALTLGPSASIRADISARRVTIFGRVTGDVVASELVAVRDGGSVEGRILAPRVALDDGAFFRGAIEMRAPAPARESASRVVAPPIVMDGRQPALAV